MSFFLVFVWIFRDFILELEVDGEFIIVDDYLEFLLKLRKGIDKKSKSFNDFWLCI